VYEVIAPLLASLMSRAITWAESPILTTKKFGVALREDVGLVREHHEVVTSLRPDQADDALDPVVRRRRPR